MKKFVVKKQLTNVKPPKTNEPLLITTTTDGGFRMTDAGASILGAKHGDYAKILMVGDEDGQNVFALVKGTPADEATGTKASGARLANPSDKIGGSLTFSAAFAYKEMGGGPNVNRVYAIDPEQCEIQYEEDGEVKTVLGHVLTHVRNDVPTKRADGSEASAEEVVAENEPEQAQA